MSTDDTPPVNPARKALPPALRYEILRRDNYTCRYCGESAPNVVLHVDHVIPSVLNGTDDPSNLVTACKDCNTGKGSTPPDAETVADIEADALRYRSAIDRAADQIREARQAQNDLADRFAEWWDSWTYKDRPNFKIYRPDASWRQTVINYVERGLPADDLFANVEIAMKSKAKDPDKWRYFCGICRNQLEKIAEVAAQILAAERIESERRANASGPPVDFDLFKSTDDLFDESDIDWSDYGSV